MDRIKATRRLIGAVSMAALLAACGGGSDAGDGAGLARHDATAVSANSAIESGGGPKALNNKVKPVVRPGVEAPLDSAPGSADDAPGATNPAPPLAKQLFATGFENGVALTEPRGDRLGDRQLVGSDIAGYNFPMDFWAAPTHWHSWVLSMVGEVAATPVTDYLTASLKKVTGRTGAPTRALSLHSRVRSGGSGSQQIVVQNVGMAIEPVVFQRMWVKFDAGTLARAQQAGERLFFQTFWEAIARPDYRIRVGIAYDNEVGLYWKAKGDLMDGADLQWKSSLKELPVVLASHAAPEGWHKVEIWMDRAAGQFKVAIDGQVLAERKGGLIGASRNRVDLLRLMMVHSAAAPLGEVLFDELEVWDAPPWDARP
jgi:hypothetical protein